MCSERRKCIVSLVWLHNPWLQYLTSARGIRHMSSQHRISYRRPGRRVRGDHPTSHGRQRVWSTSSCPRARPPFLAGPCSVSIPWASAIISPMDPHGVCPAPPHHDYAMACRNHNVEEQDRDRNFDGGGFYAVAFECHVCPRLCLEL